ncbi:hypothetical protein GCM10011607_12630 [Shewanella inventionis]|uniref:Uncharacterized protein n=1 Tax=Shewanella inventionis TaxID=1738770 RepID=A0ABQ1IYK9_9GAMM|nr:hypothetical protein [Shewanella inventionis]GGB53545.1 hypothetical protein GCM10011607_12630 [Shewanella inventionis]
MHCISLFAESSSNDTYLDHLLVLNNAINRIDNMRTPYLFTTLSIGNRKVYLVRAELPNLQESMNPVPEQCEFMNVNTTNPIHTSFFIRLNPAIRRGIHNGPSGKKTDRLYPVKSSDDIEKWFIEKCLSMNINVTRFDVLQKGVAYSSKGHTSINEAYAYVEVSASKRVLMELYSQGFGKRKGFGFGMAVFAGSNHYRIIHNVLVAPFSEI